MNQLQRYIEAFASLPAQVTQAQAELESRETLTLSRTDGRPSGGRYACLNELFVQATTDGKTGMLYTQKIDEEPMNNILAAAENARFSAQTSPWLQNDASASCRFAPTGVPATREQMEQQLARIDQALAASDPHLLSRQVELSRYATKLAIANSDGLQSESEHLFYELSVSMAADHNGTTEVEFEVFAQELAKLSPQEIARTAQRKLAEHLPLTQWQSGSCRCVLDASVVCNIFITAWQLFSGKLVGEHNSCLWNRLDQTVFSPQLNIVDRIESPYSGYHAALDCEGSRAVELDLVRDGRVCGWMHNLSTAAQLGAASTGNAGRKPMISGAVQTDVVVVPKNLMVLPGQQTTDELIAQMGDGLFVNQSFDVFHSISLASGNFSIPCEAIVVRQGRPVGRVEGMTLEGNLLELFSSVTAVGSEMFTFAMPIIKSFAVSALALAVSSIKVRV